MTIIEKTGNIQLKVVFEGKPVTMTDKNGNRYEKTLRSVEGRVICPSCKRNTIAFVKRTTTGRDISGHCKRCKKRFWFDVFETN